VPLVHAKLAHANLDVEAVVVFGVDSPSRQVLAHHVFVDNLAALNLGDQSPPRLGKLSEEPLVPHLLVGVARLGPLAGADTDKATDLSAGPFVYHGFVERLGRRIERAHPVVVKP